MAASSASPPIPSRQGSLVQDDPYSELLRTGDSNELKFRLEVHFPGTNTETPSLVFGPEKPPLTGTRRYAGDLPNNLDGLKDTVAQQCRDIVDISGVGVAAAAYDTESIVLKFQDGHAMDAAYYKELISDDGMPAEHVGIRRRTRKGVLLQEAFFTLPCVVRPCSY